MVLEVGVTASVCMPEYARTRVCKGERERVRERVKDEFPWV